jgi:hypothetical protein
MAHPSPPWRHSRKTLISGDPRFGGGSRVLPSGYYGITPPGSFTFEIINSKIKCFLSGIKDGQKLRVDVNGSPNSIEVIFETDGLEEILKGAGLRAVPMQKPSLQKGSAKKRTYSRGRNSSRCS